MSALVSSWRLQERTSFRPSRGCPHPVAHGLAAPTSASVVTVTLPPPSYEDPVITIQGPPDNPGSSPQLLIPNLITSTDSLLPREVRSQVPRIETWSPSGDIALPAFSIPTRGPGCPTPPSTRDVVRHSNTSRRGV